MVGFIAAVLCVPFIRSVYYLGDEGILLNGATRLLKGSRLYIDFFEAFPPGGFVLTAVWFDMVGTSMLSVRVLAILCIVLIACLIYLTCWQVSKHIFSSVFLAVGWVVMSQGFWTEVSHHYYYIVLPGRTFSRYRECPTYTTVATVVINCGCSGWRGGNGYSYARSARYASCRDRFLTFSFE